MSPFLYPAAVSEEELKQMKQKKLRFASRADGLELSLLITQPDTNPVGVVQFAHGMSEHKERYLPFMEFLADHGYVSIINDHRGHGESVREPEDLGHFSAEALLADLKQISEYIRLKHPNLPLFLFGHSMGSLAVRAYAARWDDALSGLFVCGSPGRNPAVGAGRLLAKLIARLKGERFRCPLLAQMSTGAFAKAIPDAKTEFDWLNTDAAAVQAYIDDPLCGFPFTAVGYESLFTLMQLAYAKAPAGKPGLPVHFLSGENDPCAPNRKGFEDAACRFRARGYENVTSKMYDGLRHEILNEPARMQVWADILEELESWQKG